MAVTNNAHDLYGTLSPPGLGEGRFCLSRSSRSGPAMFRHACVIGLEGIVSKRRDAPYRSGRRPNWIKIKRRRDRVLLESLGGAARQSR